MFFKFFEFTAICNALIIVDHLEGIYVAFRVDSQSVILTLKSKYSHFQKSVKWL